MAKSRPHCSELPDVQIPAPTLTIIRHFLIQDDDSSTVEEGFSVTPRDKWDDVRHTLYRGTVLTDIEFNKNGWSVTEEDLIDRAKYEFGDADPVVEGIRFLLNVIESQDAQIKELKEK